MDSYRQLLYIAHKRRDIIKSQAFVYDKFDHIEWIHATRGHNG